MKDSIFKEYDIQGKVPSDINEDIAYKIGLGYGSFIQEFLSQEACVVSYDNRPSSEVLHKSLIKGLLETGIKVIDYGLTTTPMHYYARHINNLLGIMVTTSNENIEYSGFKFSFDEYANAKGIMVKDLKTYIDKDNFQKGNGTLEQKNIKEDYINYIISHLKFGKKKIKVVLDTSNGASTIVAEDIFEKLNIDLTIISEEDLEQLKNKVKEIKANIGIRIDKDGDSLIIIDELGNKITPEAYGVIILRNIIDKVENKKFLYDVKCSDIFRDEVLKLGGTPLIYRTGASYNHEKIIKENIPFGIQHDGHISINDRLFNVESAIYASLRLVEILSKTERTLSELINTVPTYFNIPEQKFLSSAKKKYQVIENIKKYCNEKNYKYIEIDGIKVIFKDSWAYIRCDQDNNYITLNCESKEQNSLNNLEKIFSTLIDIYNK